MYKHNAYKLNRNPLYALPMNNHKSFNNIDVLSSTSKRLKYLHIPSLLEGKPIFALRDGCKTCYVELMDKGYYADLGQIKYFIAYINMRSKNINVFYALFQEKDKTFDRLLPKLKEESNVIPSTNISLEMNNEPIYKETSGEVEVKSLIANLISELNNCEQVQS